MKRVFFLLMIIVSLSSFGQNLNNEPKQSIQLRIKDIGWLIGKQGTDLDSVVSVFQNRLYKIIEDTIAVYGINNSLNKVARVDSVPPQQIVFLYYKFAKAEYGEVWAMGSNTSERNFIGAQVKANANPVIQFYIDVIDENADSGYFDILKKVWQRRRKP